MSQSIRIIYEDKTYELGFTRATVKTLESQGLTIEDMQTKPATAFEKLFQGAFLANHKGVKRRVVNEMFENIDNKTELLQALMVMFSETYESLLSSEGNVTWELSD